MNTFEKAVTLLLFSVSLARCDTIVVPPGNATQNGDNSLGQGFNTPNDLEVVYSAKYFSGPIEITGLSFRQDQGTGQEGSFEAIIPQVTIQLSTYRGTFQSFQQSYDQNKGLDEATLFDAPVDWKTTDLAGSQPNPFDFKIAFTKPFIYYPSAGSLLLHYQAFGPISGGGVIADIQTTSVDGSGGWFAPNHTLGVSFGVLVTQFDVTSVPEPPPMPLILFCSILFFAVRRKL